MQQTALPRGQAGKLRVQWLTQEATRKEATVAPNYVGPRTLAGAGGVFSGSAALEGRRLRM